MSIYYINTFVGIWMRPTMCGCAHQCMDVPINAWMRLSLLAIRSMCAKMEIEGCCLTSQTRSLTQSKLNAINFH